MTFESSKFQPEKQTSDASLFSHTLIQQEFRELLTNGQYEIPENVEAVMILSAPPNLEGKTEQEIEETPGNVERIKFGIEVYKQILAKKLKKEVREITDADLKDASSPFLVLNGETEQLPMMEKVALSTDFPLEKIKLINCGDRSIANTKTQFEKTNEDPIVGKFTHITLITTSYHVPRVARTAGTLMSENTDFEVIGIPYEDFQFDVYQKVKGEVKRIIAYTEKGDILKTRRDTK